MSATTSGIGFGATFTRSSTGATGGTMTSIGEILSINISGVSRETVDATHMASTARYKEIIGGLRDGGEISAEIAFDPDGTEITTMIADIEADTAGFYEITFPDATVWGFPAFATSFNAGVPMDDKITGTFTFQVTGQPTWV